MSDESEVALPGETLKRGLKSLQLQMISIGGVIGSAYFLGAGSIVHKAGPGSLLAFALGGIVVSLVMMCLGELAVHIPTTGSFVSYANQFIHPVVGCAVGWCYWLNWIVFMTVEMVASGRIMHHWFESVPENAWAIAFCILLTVLNLADVKTFGEMEVALSLLKIFALVGFVGLAALIYAGLLGSPEPGFVNKVTAAPVGVWEMFLTMVLVLSNYQGAEIVGLGAGESAEPEKTIPASIKAVTLQSIALFIIPVAFLLLIYPWDMANGTDCVFTEALNHYGLRWAGGAISFVILTSAISCASSGIYAASRVVYALAREGQAPPFLAQLNAKLVPFAAILFTVGGCWCILGLQFFGDPASVYEKLLAVAGFSGTVVWISICWSQLGFRRRLESRGYDTRRLRFRAPWFPWLTHFAIWIQIICMIIAAMNGDFKWAIAAAFGLMLVPMVWYAVWGKNLPRLEAPCSKFEDMLVREST